MEPLDGDELSEQELDAILKEWDAPHAPATLKAAIFPARAGGWWTRLWQVRVPLPAAVAMAAVLAFGVWRWAEPAAPSTQALGAPDRQARVLRPVMELKPIVLGRAE